MYILIKIKRHTVFCIAQTELSLFIQPEDIQSAKMSENVTVGVQGLWLVCNLISNAISYCLCPLAGCWDTDQCSALSAPDQRAVEPSASSDAAAAEDQWPAERHWNHLTDQSLLLVLHQHVPLLHTHHSQVRKIVVFFCCTWEKGVCIFAGI